jgi:hypothetical protein
MADTIAHQWLALWAAFGRQSVDGRAMAGEWMAREWKTETFLCCSFSCHFQHISYERIARFSCLYEQQLDPAIFKQEQMRDDKAAQVFFCKML